MTTLATRKQEIEELEGFEINIFDSTGNLADLNMQGQPAYGYTRKAAGTMTVVEWRNSRFQFKYPGFTCEILESNGIVAHGNKKLSSIRQ